MRLRPTVLALLALAAPLAAGCGGDEPTTDVGSRPALADVVLALDFTPNPVHAPVYAAVASRHDLDNGIRLKVRKPGTGPDSLKLVSSGKVDIGILDIHDLAIAREAGADVVAVGALVTKPLAALIAKASIRRPRDLEGETVGVSGLPSDPAFLRAVVEHDGGDYEKVRQATIGFNAVASLISGKIAAVPAFWNAEGVTLTRRGFRSREFRFEDYGAPPYPEVVLIAARERLDRDREKIGAVVRTVAEGVASVRAKPDAAARAVAAAGGGDLELVQAQLDAVMPLFAPELELDRAVLERWAEFDERIGIVKDRPDVGRSFDFGFTG